MKVTPRLPLHGAFANYEGFVEMRYFRLQGESVLAAVLYGLLEEANFPQSRPLRKRLNEMKDNSSCEDKRLLEFVLDPLIKQEVLLSMWNSLPFYLHLKRIFQDTFRESISNEVLLDSLQREFNCEIVNCRDLTHYRPGSVSIICGDIENGAILLYRQYAVNSIVMTPCRHFFLKWDLFRYMRETMGKPETLEECTRQGGFRCRCKADITQMAFNLGKEEAQFLETNKATEIYYDILVGFDDFRKYGKSTNYSKCCCCGQTEGVAVCSKWHRMCMMCLASNAITRLQFHCLLCQEPISDHLNEELIDQISDVVGTSRENINIMCEGCRIERHFSEFFDNSRVPHNCLICRECKGRFEDRCPSCEKPLAGAGSFARPRTASIELSTGTLRCESCTYEKNITAFGSYLLTAHKCIVCDMCAASSSFPGAGRCPQCNQMNAFADKRNKGKSDDLLTINCLVCSSKRDIREFSNCSRLSHWFKCRICNICLKARPTHHCQICAQSYSQSDMKTLSDQGQKVPAEERKSQNEVKATDRSELRCIKCGIIQEPRNFSIHYELQHTCFVCDYCFAAYPANLNDIWQSSQRCPNCPTVFDYKCSRIISEAVRKVKSDQAYYCGLCRRQKPKYEMTKCLSLDHSCKLCNECIAKPIEIRKCQVCSMMLSESDLRKLGRIPTVRTCPCGNSIATGSSYVCPKMCLCTTCIIKHCWVSNQFECPKCSFAVTNYSLILPSCSHCHRQLNEKSADIFRRISGICLNQHILCCFCINVYPSTSSCKVCNRSVDIGFPAAIETEQGRFKLACFCGEAAGGRHLVKLKCGHEVHYSCHGSIYFCRLCPEQLKPAPPPKLLPDYLH